MSSSPWRNRLINENLAAAVGYAWADNTSWMHRRVDTIEFLDSTTIHIRALLELTIPNTPPAPRLTGPTGGLIRVLPIMLQNKKLSALAFAIQDENGTSLSRLRSQEAAIIGSAVLALVAKDILLGHFGSVPNMSKLRRGLSILCRRDSTESVEDAWRLLLARDWGMSPAERRAIIHDPMFRRWVRMLTENFFVCLGLEGAVGESRTIKISYETHTNERLAGDDSERNGKDLPSRLGWKDTSYFIAVPAANCASYHCEIIHPAGVNVRSVKLWKDPLQSTRARNVSVRFDATSSRSHIVATGPRTKLAEYYIEIRCRIERGGWLAMATILGWAISSLFIISGFQFSAENGRTAGVSADPATLIGTLLLAVGAAAVAVLIRVNEHQLTSRLLQYSRVTINFLVALSFFIVLALAFASPQVLKWSLFAAGALALIGSSALTVPQLPLALDRVHKVSKAIARVLREP